MFLGASSGPDNTTGSRNTFLGYQAGYLNKSGSDNVFIGPQAGGFIGSGNQNTIIGSGAGAVSSGSASANTLVGYRAGLNTTGQFNTFIGVQTGLNNTTGSSNYMMGTNAGLANSTGSGNYFLGDNAGGGNTGGSFNIYIGANAGNGTNVNGDNNLAIGFEAGRANVAGLNNTFIGFRADAGANGLSNATAIGNNARVNVSNAVVLGNGANVGIGTSSPTVRLQINTGVANQSGVRLENLTSASPATALNQTKFLTVDGSGNVILASTTSGGRIAAEAESLWQRKGRYLTSQADNAVIIGSNVSRTPAGYRLYVQEGILTEKVKVAVKNTGEWSDHVFAPTYKLVPLAEVEQHIQRHGHLPGVPSAKQMVEQGNDLHRTDAKLLEKIEELTLYVLKQQKELESIKQQNQQMKQEVSDLRARLGH
ncbi:bZIP transcription factor [Fibrisoma montanum]|uniref:BZIP transcription factor n=1 Tax=Fibrisoma montanum TaxID=2305895 RepID=A0A418MFU5_9BACT|nr:bZIP transcription factor [Fibrisoma montanum]